MVKPVTHLTAKGLNGLGSFILPCKRITLRYCNWGGSSKGMREFLRTDLKKIAQENPKIEFVVRRESGHPVVKGDYTNGNDKVVCVRNMTPAEIRRKIDVVRNSSGAQLKKHKVPVISQNPSVRGIWSPFHVDKEYRFKI